jgi:LysM repeat protein
VPEPIEATAPEPPVVPESAPTLEPAASADATQPFRVPNLGMPVAPAVAAVAEGPGASEIDPGRAWLARLDDRSLDPNICPFLRATADGKLISPVETPDPTNRCAALNEAVPQSLRQQELVCLSSGHVNCPRYLRGSITATETPVPVVRARRTLTTPIFVSLVILVMTISASAAFVMARGGLVLSGDVASPSPIAAVSTPSPSVVATPAAVASASPSIASPSSFPSASPSVTPAPSVTAQPTPSATPTSDRYKLLKPCPNTPKCWIYTVRHGDNVFSIAHYFGVSTDSIYARNPWLRQTGLRAGQQLRLPPPTR